VKSAIRAPLVSPAEHVTPRELLNTAFNSQATPLKAAVPIKMESFWGGGTTPIASIQGGRVVQAGR